MAATKTEDGASYPAEAYAYVPDREAPSTWKLRLWETPEKKVTIAQLGRAAAALSPGGFRGNRVELPANAVAAVKRRIRAEYRKLGVKEADMPKAVFSDEAMVEREAKLFEAGSYPDKEIEITEDDLDVICRNFAEVPVKVEHSDTPFDGALGVLRSIYRKGRELLGKIGFTPAAWALVDAANARKLSVAIKRDKSALAEVSLVRQPRVAGAQVFDDRIEFPGGEVDAGTEDEKLAFAREVLALVTSGETTGGDTTMPDSEVKTFTKEEIEKLVADSVTKAQADATEKARAEFADDLAAKDAKIAALEAKDRERDTQARIDELKRAGKLVPAAEPFAKAILLADKGDVVEFGDEKLSVTALFAKLMEAQPAVIKFGEQGAAGENDVVAKFSTAEVEAAMKLPAFAGKTKDEVIELMAKHARA